MLPSSQRAAPWLSVVIPTHNGARYVSMALESIAAQRADDIEVIVVDDCSTDETPSRVAEASRRMHLRIVRNERQLGWMATTNAGWRAARGQWVCTLHQDDVWTAGHVNALRDALHGSPKAGLIIGASRFIDAGGARIGQWRLPWRGESPRREEVARRLYVQNFLAVPAACIRADVLRDVGMLDEHLWYTADWDLWLKVTRVSSVATARGVLAGFRIHHEAQTVSRSIDLASFERQLRAVQERHRWAAGSDHNVLLAGEAALRTNVALAALMHGERPDLRGLAAAAMAMPPGGWLRYFRDSRLIDRAIPRARLRFAPHWPSTSREPSPAPREMQRI